MTDIETPTPNLPSAIEQRLATMRAALKTQLAAPPSNKIATKGKQFTLPDGKSHPGPLSVIIVDFAWLLAHYPGVYNANNPQSPNCWAIGRDFPESGLLKPDKSIEKPQGADCRTCPKNQWKSDNNGRGKACKNQRRLIVVAGDLTDPSTATLLTLYVSPTGLKNWDGYVNTLEKQHGLLPIQVITEISFDQNQTYPTLLFSMAGKHGHLEAVMSLQAQAEEQLMRPMELRDAA